MEKGSQEVSISCEPLYFELCALNFEPVELIIKFNVQISKFKVIIRVLQRLPHEYLATYR